MGNKTMNKNLGNYTSSAIIIGASLLLSACSTGVTRFDYPAMGYNSSETDSSIFGDTNSYPTPSRSSRSGRSYDSGVADEYDSSSNTSSGQDAKVASYSRGNVQSETVRELSPPSRQRSYQPRRISNFGSGKPATSYSQNNGATNENTVRVVQGDTLYSISRRYGLKPADFMAANNMEDTTVRLGQLLTVPAKGGSRNVVASAKPRTSRSAPKPVSNFQYASDKNRTSAISHTVQSSETLYSVARKYGVSYVQLAQWNGLEQNAGLRIGQKLSLKPGMKPVRRVAKLKDSSGSRNDAARTGLWNKRSAPKAVKPKAVVAKIPRPRKLAALKTVRKAAPKRRVGGFRWPVRGRIISKFGPMANGKNNDGVNFAVPMGTQVKAADNGVVAYAGSELKGYGNLVLIRHANNFVSAYAHNSSLKVRRGDRIKRGQVVALVGKTGDVSQPQLHFELRKGSKPIDPMQYMSK